MRLLTPLFLFKLSAKEKGSKEETKEDPVRDWMCAIKIDWLCKAGAD